MSEPKICAIPHCSNEVQGEHRLTCGPVCAKLWPTYRYLDPERAAQHRIQQAQSVLRKPEGYPEASRRWAGKVLAEAEGVTS